MKNSGQNIEEIIIKERDFEIKILNHKKEIHIVHRRLITLADIRVIQKTIKKKLDNLTYVDIAAYSFSFIDAS